MKALYMLVLAAALAALASVPALAVTEAWSYGDDLATVYQILADGAGGCAMYGITTNGQSIIVWLDKKGTATYTKRITNSMYGLAAASKKEIVYSNATASPYVFTHVDKKGVETSVTDAAFNLATTQLGPPGLAQNQADSKGFFAIKLPLGPGVIKLVRFNYK
ncbi:MAG: hypothetical protein NTV22_02830 [bacterium]|nr:hypothetical protein [bacterium]